MTYDIIQLRSKKQDKALKITKLSSDREKAVKIATSNVLSTGDFVRFIDVRAVVAGRVSVFAYLTKKV